MRLSEMWTSAWTGTIFLDIISAKVWAEVVVVKAGFTLRSPLLNLFELQKNTQLLERGCKVFRE